MSMTRGLHPETMPQRQGEPGDWAVPVGDEVEYRDAPMRAVGKGLGWIVAVLLLIVAAVLIFTSATRPRTPLTAARAEARFRAPAPTLQVAAPAARAALERDHAGPGAAAIEQAMERVAAHGWGDGAPPPARPEVAMHRAEAGR
jgi:hypothetical protein